jgi:CRP-like cAMP-binding protein
MNNEKLLRFLMHTGAIDAQLAHEVAGQFDHKMVAKSECLVTEGKTSNDYYILEQGGMRGFVIDTKGVEVTTTLYLPGQPVFDVSSFFLRIAAKETIQAVMDCTGWSISFDRLNHLFHSIPAFRETGRATLVKGYASLKERMLAQITATAEERYLQLLATSPDVVQMFPLKYIASYLGITDTSLSRIRKEMARR